MALKAKPCDNDIQQAVGQVVSQYEQQLIKEQSHTRMNTSQQSCRVAGTGASALQVSLASQMDLPSVGATQEGVEPEG